jgi:hypothetical protein
MDFDKEEVKSLLRENKCSVTFEKVNGEIRKMLCTLNSSLIPQEEVEAGEKRTKVENVDVLPVYDLESNGRRSFRWNSLKEFELV